MTKTLDTQLDYPAAVPRMGPNTPSGSSTPQVAAVLPVDRSEASGWVPAFSLNEGIDALQNVLTSQDNTRTVEVGYQSAAIASIVGRERDAYVAAVKSIFENWEANGRIATKEMFERLSDERIHLRVAIREKSILPGYFYKVWDFVNGRNRTDLATKAGRYGQEVETLLQQQKFEEAILRVFKTKQSSNVVATTLSKYAPAVGRASELVMAVQIPIYVAKAYTAKGVAELQDAWKPLAGITATLATSYTLCFALGLTTGGIGFLACGVAPIAAGLVAEEAAQRIITNLEKLP